LRAVTPFGGLSLLIEFFGRIGLVEQLQSQEFYQPKSPNHYQPGQILADHFCLRSFFSTESAFLAVVFSFNLLSEFQRAINPALKSYKQLATLRFEVFTCGAILGRSGHHLVLHMSKNWGAIRNESRSLPASYIGLRQLLRDSTRQQKMPHDFQCNFGI
jgi:hypothetical protein